MKNRKEVISEIMHCLHHQKRAVYRPEKTKYQITPLQLQFLMCLKAEKSMSIKDLAAHFQMSSSAATQVIDSLDNKGYIDRSSSEHDRRLMLIAVNEKAKAEISKIKERHAKIVDEIFSPLSDQELQDYLKLNEKIVSNLECKKQ